MNKIPVLFFGSAGEISGVNSIGLYLKKAVNDDDHYQFILVNVGKKITDKANVFDYHVTHIKDIRELLMKYSKAVVIPNWFFMVFAICAELNAQGHNLYCIGYCHAISLDEYYTPLSHFEPLIERFVAVSRECLKGLAEHLVSKSSRICLLETPIDVPPLQLKSKSNGVIRIIYAGRMIQQQKRILDFIELIRALENIGLNYQFVLIGSGPDLNLFREELKEKIHNCPVQVIGALTHSETLERFAESDVFVQVSEYEGMSVSLLEAMAHGAVPVITNAGSGVQGVVKNGVNGFVLNVGDMRSMAAQIVFLVDNRAQFEEMSKKARAKAMEFSIDNYVKKFRVMLDEVCAASIRQWPVGRSLLFPGMPLGISNSKTFWRSPVSWFKRHMRAFLNQ